MPIWVWPFFFVGLGASACTLWSIARELFCCVRQSLRIAYVVNRLEGRRGFKPKAWAKAFRYELTAQYSALTLGHFRIDRRLSVPISRAY